MAGKERVVRVHEVKSRHCVADSETPVGAGEKSAKELWPPTQP
jgi:hypothetical protein